ncbi:PIN domain-containing protein [Mesorhizobium sp. 1B3]
MPGCPLKPRLPDGEIQIRLRSAGDPPVIPFEQAADSHYGDICATLETAGQTIGMNDLLIAAHARALNATIVTANYGEFRRIDRLRIENWLE